MAEAVLKFALEIIGEAIAESGFEAREDFFGGRAIGGFAAIELFGAFTWRKPVVVSTERVMSSAAMLKEPVSRSTFSGCGAFNCSVAGVLSTVCSVFNTSM